MKVCAEPNGSRRRLFALVLVVGALASALIYSAAGTAIKPRQDSRLTSPDKDIFAVVSRPLLEVVRPLNGEVLESDKLAIVLNVEGYTLPSLMRDSKICLSLACRGKVLVEQCFEQTHSLDYRASGLAAGQNYQLRAYVLHRNEVIAVSIRSFRVAGIKLEEEPQSLVTLETALQVALSLHEAGNHQAAELIYRKILAERPMQPDALHLLGVALYQMGDPFAAIDYIERAIESKASFDNFHNSLGECLRAVGRISEAIEQYKKALSISPTFIEAKMNLARAYQTAKDWENAITLYKEIADQEELSPGDSTSVLPMGQEKPLTDVSSLDPTDVEEYNQKPPEERAIAEQPPAIVAKKLKFQREARMRQCDLLLGLGRIPMAQECYHKGQEQWPEDSHFYSELGNIHLEADDHPAALKYFQGAALRGNEHAEINVAVTQELLGYHSESRMVLDKVLARLGDRSLPSAHLRIKRATILPRVLPPSENLKVMRAEMSEKLDRLLLESPNSPDLIEPLRSAFSNGFYLSFHNGSNRNLRTKLARVYSTYIPALLSGDFVGPKASDSMPALSQSPGRVKLGIVCRRFFSYLCQEVVHIMKELNRRKFEVIAFILPHRSREDAVRKLKDDVEKVLRLPERLQDCHHLLKAELLDILIFSEVHVGVQEYFLSFGRFAPAQGTFWFHPDTTGSPSMDFFLSSEYEHRGAQAEYSETLVRLRGLGAYLKPPPLPRNRKPREAIKETVGLSFQVPSSYRLYVVPQSQTVLPEAQDSVLRQILSKDLLALVVVLIDSTRTSWTELLQQRFQKTIGHPLVKRIHLLDTRATDFSELDLFQAADVVLDGLVFNVFPTSYEVLYLGTPIVTMEGHFWRSRITASMYRQMGLCNSDKDGALRGQGACCIVKSEREYVQLALMLAHNERRRAAVVSLIKSNVGKLFLDRRVISSVERFFLSIQRLKKFGSVKGQGTSESAQDEHNLQHGRNVGKASTETGNDEENKRFLSDVVEIDMDFRRGSEQRMAEVS